MNRRRLALFLPLAGFAILALFLARGLQLDPSEVPSALLDKPLPAFALPELSTGNTVTEADWRGQKALVNVWATWCITCHAEHPFLLQLASQGVLLRGINYKDKADEARRWLANKGNPFRDTVFDADGKLGINLGVSGAPETYFIDSHGVIRYKHVGELNARVWDERLHAVWQSLP